MNQSLACGVKDIRHNLISQCHSLASVLNAISSTSAEPHTGQSKLFLTVFASLVPATCSLM